MATLSELSESEQSVHTHRRPGQASLNHEMKPLGSSRRPSLFWIGSSPRCSSELPRVRIINPISVRSLFNSKQAFGSGAGPKIFGALGSAGFTIRDHRSAPGMEAVDASDLLRPYAPSIQDRSAMARVTPNAGSDTWSGAVLEAATSLPTGSR